jgi:MOSC domain-containing protein YiiM
MIRYNSDEGRKIAEVIESNKVKYLVHFTRIENLSSILERGVLMEDIHVDIDLYHLKKGSIIEVGDLLLEVVGACEDYRYLYAFAPELPELLEGNRGLFVSIVDDGQMRVGDEVKVITEA